MRFESAVPVVHQEYAIAEFVGNVQVGPTVVLYDWLPDAALDLAAPEIQRALETLGVGYPIEG